MGVKQADENRGFAHRELVSAMDKSNLKGLRAGLPHVGRLLMLAAWASPFNEENQDFVEEIIARTQVVSLCQYKGTSEEVRMRLWTVRHQLEFWLS